MIVIHFRSTTIKQQLTHVSNCCTQAMMEKNTKIYAQSIENINTKNRELLTNLKYFSDITTLPDVMQSSFEFENASTNISSTSDTSMISQYTIPDISSPLTKLDISTILPKFVLSHSDTDNILTESTKITEFAEKQIQQTLTPAAKYKRDTKLKNDIVSFRTKNAVTGGSYSKSTTKLIKLFGKVDFVISFDTSRKKIKKDSKNSIFNTNYQTELAVVEVRINNLEESLLSKLNMLEKQQYFHQYEDDPCLSSDQKTEFGKVIESLKIIKVLKKDLDLH